MRKKSAHRIKTCLDCNQTFQKTGANQKRCHSCREKHRLHEAKAYWSSLEGRAKSDAWRRGPGVPIIKALNRQNYLAKRNERIEYAARWREENREAFDEWARKNYRAREAEIARNNRERKYGQNIKVLRAIYDAQGGACAICKASITFRFGCVDHDHGTLEVRGFLCRSCNRGLGLAGAA